MRTGLVSAVAILLLPAAAAAAARSVEPPADHPLAPLSWLVGGTWVSRIDSPDGAPTRVECRFQWAENGQALKFVIHFKAGDEVVPQYEGMYYWHPGKKRIQMLQVGRGGNVTESVVTVDGARMAQENEAARADGTTSPQRVSVTRTEADAFEFKAQVLRDGQWVEAVGFTYRREPDRAAGPKPGSPPAKP